jgi:hypothetical protein
MEINLAAKNYYVKDNYPPGDDNIHLKRIINKTED